MLFDKPPTFRASVSNVANKSYWISASEGVTLHDEIVRACSEAGFSPQLAQPAPQVSSVINLAAGLGVPVVPAAIAQAQGVRFVDAQGTKMRARLAL